VDAMGAHRPALGYLHLPAPFPKSMRSRKGDRSPHAGEIFMKLHYAARWDDAWVLPPPASHTGNIAPSLFSVRRLR
jgi:hypothetical protein